MLFLLTLALSFYGKSICATMAVVPIVLHVLPDRIAFFIDFTSLDIGTHFPRPPSHDPQCDEGQRFLAEKPRTCGKGHYSSRNHLQLFRLLRFCEACGQVRLTCVARGSCEDSSTVSAKTRSIDSASAVCGSRLKNSTDSLCMSTAAFWTLNSHDSSCCQVECFADLGKAVPTLLYQPNFQG